MDMNITTGEFSSVIIMAMSGKDGVPKIYGIYKIVLTLAMN